MKDDYKQQPYLHPFEAAIARDAIRRQKADQERAELQDAVNRAHLRELEERWREREIERQRIESGQTGASLTMLGRILTHVPTTIPKLAKKLHISRTLLYVFRDSGGKPVKGKLGKDKVREIKTALRLEVNRLGMAPSNKEAQKELTN